METVDDRPAWATCVAAQAFNAEVARREAERYQLRSAALKRAPGVCEAADVIVRALPQVCACH